MLAWAFMLGCAHGNTEPPPRIIERHTNAARAASSGSFRERTGPHHAVKDVTHVEVNVHRVEGPESIVLGFATIDRLAEACWRDREALVIYPTDHDDAVKLTIDTRADGTMEEVEVEPVSTPKTIAMCLIHALSMQPLHAEPGPHRVVLLLNARVWWTG